MTERHTKTLEPDISVELFGIKLENPTILASGVLGTSCGILRSVAQHGAGAVTIKSISVNPRKGHPNPTVLAFEAGLINAVGYSNPGLEKAVEEFQGASEVGCPVIGSLIGTELDDFARVAQAFDKLPFVALEVPVSCPHTPGFGKMAAQDRPEAVYEIVKTLRANTSKPILVKVPPATNALVELGLAAKEAGAYGITAVNTVGPGMLINIKMGRPYLGFGVGGLSGPALKPLAVAAVFQLRAAVDLPIIGTGGVSTGSDAIALIMAGATAVGIGSAVSTRGMSVFKDVANEMRAILKELGKSSLAEIRGIAHEK